MYLSLSLDFFRARMPCSLPIAHRGTKRKSDQRRTAADPKLIADLRGMTHSLESADGHP